MKYNLSIMKNKKIKFNIFIEDKEINFINLVKNIKQTKKSIFFIFENSSLEINKDIFNHMLVKYDSEKELIILKQDKTNKYISSFVGFTLFDTYGFPIEMTEEIMGEKNLKIDLEGFYILRKLSKNPSQNNNAFYASIV